MKRSLSMSLVLVAFACNGRLAPEEASRAAQRAASLYPVEYLDRAPKFESRALTDVLTAEVEGLGNDGPVPILHRTFIDAGNPRFVTIEGPRNLEPLFALCTKLELRHGLDPSPYPCDDLKGRVAEYEDAKKLVAQQRDTVALSPAQQTEIASYLAALEPEQLDIGEDRQVPDALLVAIMFGAKGQAPLFDHVDAEHKALATAYGKLAQHLSRIEIQAHRFVLQWAWDLRGKHAAAGWQRVEDQRLWLDNLATRLQARSREDKGRLRLDLGPDWPKSGIQAQEQAIVRVMTALSDRSVEDVLTLAAPGGGQYIALARVRERYARIVSSGGFTVLPKLGGRLKPGRENPVVPPLRTRLAQEGYEVRGSGATFDGTLETALRAFQVAHQLKPHGRLDKTTRKALDVPAKERLATIDRTLDSWRHAPDRSGRYIQVNIADFHGELWNGQTRVHRFRVVVGSPRAKKRTSDGIKLINATPQMSAAIDRVIYNPFWNIPARILQHEIVPKDLRDAPAEDRIAYLNSKGYQVRSKVEGEVANVRQPPGPGNALGRVKIIFPNRHDVYLHDTPQKHLFNRPQRAFSHGCMRVHQPLVLAQKILEADGQFDEPRITTILRLRKNHRIYLQEKVLIHIEYYTVRVDERGVVHFLNDVYGLHG